MRTETGIRRDYRSQGKGQFEEKMLGKDKNQGEKSKETFNFNLIRVECQETGSGQEAKSGLKDLAMEVAGSCGCLVSASEAIEKAGQKLSCEG